MQHISIFVSSTFKDMMYERDILRSYVLPELVNYFNPKGFDVELIDLRWGIVTKDCDETIVAQKIIKCCLETIDICKPFFIGFIGHRYGWIPPKDREHLFADGELSITHIEIQHGILDSSNFKRALIFKRDVQSYHNLSECERENYIDTDDSMRKKADLQFSSIVNAYQQSSFINNIVDYSLDVSGPSKDEIYKFSHLLFDNLKRIIEDELRLPSKSISEYAEDLFLKNYLIPLPLFNQVLDNIYQKKHSILYGLKGRGKTSLSLSLYKYIRNLGDFHCFFYSSDFQNTKEHTLKENIKIWSEKLYDSTFDALPTIQEEWNRFKYLIQTQPKPSIIILDNYDNIEEIGDSNLFLVPTKGVVFIITSSTMLPKLEECYQINGQGIPLLSLDEANSLIKRIMQTHKKQLPINIFQLLLEKCKVNELLYNPYDIIIIITYILALDKSDFDKVAGISQKTNENALYDYIESIIIEMPHDSRLRSEYIVSKISQHFNENDLAIIVYLSCSLTGLSESQLENLISSYNTTSFFLLRNYIKPYLSTNCYSSKWKINSSDLTAAIQKCTFMNIKECYYKMSLLESFPKEERFFYGLHGYNIQIVTRLYAQERDVYGKFNMAYISYLLDFFTNNENIYWFINELTNLDAEIAKIIISNLFFGFYRFARQNPAVHTIIFIESLIEVIHSKRIKLSDRDFHYYLTHLFLAHIEQSLNRNVSIENIKEEKKFFKKAECHYKYIKKESPFMEIMGKEIERVSKYFYQY